MYSLLALIGFMTASMAVIAQDNCGSATMATTGTNSLPETTDTEYWYSFTMPGEGKLQLTSSSSEKVYVYTGSCNELIGQSIQENPEILQYEYIIKLSPGVQTIFIPSGNQFILPLPNTANTPAAGPVIP